MKKFIYFVVLVMSFSMLTISASAVTTPLSTQNHADCNEELSKFKEAFIEKVIINSRRYGDSDKTSATVLFLPDGCSIATSLVNIEELSQLRYEPCGPNGHEFYTTNLGEAIHTPLGNGMCNAMISRVRACYYCDYYETYGWIDVGNHKIGTAYKCPFGETR